MSKKNIGIFLDRDGVINNDDNGAFQYSDPKKLLLGVSTALKKLNKFKSYIKIIIITNQSAVAKGYITENDLKKSLKDSLLFYENKGILIDDIFYCPYHPKIGNKKYKKNSYLRKPKPGMILKAKNKYNIDLKKSFMIGNSMVDYQAAISAGVFPLIINNKEIKIKSKFKFYNIKRATEHIIKILEISFL